MASDRKIWIGFGDIHEDLHNLRRIPNLDTASGVIISGDLTNRGSIERVRQLLEEIAAVNGNILAQGGNMDRPEMIEYLDREGFNIHARGLRLAEGFGLMGVGYSSPTPFGTPSEVPDETLGEWLEKAYQQVKDMPRLLLVAHDPPYGTAADKIPAGPHVGSRAVAEFIRRVQPDCCLTGHIHESRAVGYLGKTKVINPGMFGAGGYVEIVLEGGNLQFELKSV